MSKLNGIVKDIFTKSLSKAKSKINDALNVKVNDALNSMKSDVAGGLLKTEDVDIDESEESDLSGEEVGEELKPIKKRIDPTARRETQKYYRKKKVHIRKQQDKYKKTSAGRKTALMSKKLGKVGKTSTGKRKSTITNKVMK